MFGLFRRRGTIIAEGLKIVGSVTAEGLVEVNGHIEGDLHCTSLVVSPEAAISGGIEAERVVVNGRVEGPIRGGDVLLTALVPSIAEARTLDVLAEYGAEDVSFADDTSIAQMPVSPSEATITSPDYRTSDTADRDYATRQAPVYQTPGRDVLGSPETVTTSDGRPSTVDP